MIKNYLSVNQSEAVFYPAMRKKHFEDCNYNKYTNIFQDH